MTRKAESPFVRLLLLATALLLAPPARALVAAPAAAPDLAFLHAALSVKAARDVAAQKAARQAEAEEVADGWGTAGSVSPLLISTRATPDDSYTPGRLCTPEDPNFKEYRYAERIPYCRRTATTRMKQEIAAHYGVPREEWGNYEFDHLIPLGIGGNSSIDNLWPQPHGYPDGSGGKDRLENALYLQMRDGTITQAEAVRQIYAWFTMTRLIDKTMQAAAP